MACQTSFEPGDTAINKLGCQYTKELTPGAALNIYSMLGAIFVVGIYSYPCVFLMVSSGLEFISLELEDAATILGAGTMATTLRITLPLVMPAIVSGFMSFLEAIALWGSPTIILIPARVIITTEIWQQFQYPSNVELTSAFAICLFPEL